MSLPRSRPCPPPAPHSTSASGCCRARSAPAEQEGEDEADAEAEAEGEGEKAKQRKRKIERRKTTVNFIETRLRNKRTSPRARGCKRQQPVHELFLHHPSQEAGGYLHPALVFVFVRVCTFSCLLMATNSKGPAWCLPASSCSRLNKNALSVHERGRSTLPPLPSMGPAAVWPQRNEEKERRAPTTTRNPESNKSKHVVNSKPNPSTHRKVEALVPHRLRSALRRLRDARGVAHRE